MEACLISRAESRAAARIERKDALLDLAYGTLMCQYMAATLAPLSKIPTPAWVDSQTDPKRRATLAESSLIDVLSDQLAGVGSEQMWSDLIAALCVSAQGREFLRARAKEHADFHAAAAAYGED